MRSYVNMLCVVILIIHKLPYEGNNESHKIDHWTSGPFTILSCKLSKLTRTISVMSHWVINLLGEYFIFFLVHINGS